MCGYSPLYRYYIEVPQHQTVHRPCIAIAAQWQQVVESMFSLPTYSSEGFGLHGLYKSAVTLGYSL